MAGHEIAVEVREHHVLDSRACGGRVRDVFGDVPLGVDHDGHAGCLIYDQVGSVREALKDVLFDEQRGTSRRRMSQGIMRHALLVERQ